jgi:hypothetical protein
MKYRIEKFEGKYDLCYTDEDGVTNVVETFTYGRAALAALVEANCDRSGDERHYQAQYAHACGYHD